MKIYPFPAQLVPENGGPTMAGHIVLLTNLGVLFQIPELSNLRVADQQRLSFELPISGLAFNELVKMIKVYSKWDVAKDGAKTKVQIFEWHFLELASARKAAIDQVNALAAKNP